MDEYGGWLKIFAPAEQLIILQIIFFAVIGIIVLSLIGAGLMAIGGCLWDWGCNVNYRAKARKKE
ncbi:MAG: hypothetical protein AAB731_01265 [Patescibacteria group bacterium]